MPRNSSTGVFTRVSNSFSDPVFGTTIDPVGAHSLFDDYDNGLTNSIPKEPTSAAGDSTIPVSAGTAALAITGTALTATTVELPTVAAQDGLPLNVVDMSTAAADHTITIVPNGSEKIMNLSSWVIKSISSQNVSVTLYPSTHLGGWYVAPNVGVISIPSGGTGLASISEGAQIYGSAENVYSEIPNTRISTSINADIAAIGSSKTTLIVNDTQTLSGDLVIPGNVTLQINQGGSIASSGHSLSIQGPFIAPRIAVFSGFAVGDVGFAYGLTVYPEWWGGLGDGNLSNATGTDNLVPINCSVAAIIAGSRVMFTGGLIYNISDVISATTGIAFVAEPSFATIQSTGTSASGIQFGGSYGAQVNKPVIQNLYIRRATGVATTGGVGVTLYYTSLAKVSNVHTENFQIGFYRQRATNSVGTDLLATCTQNLNNWVGYSEDGDAASGDTAHLGNASSAYTNISSVYVGSGTGAIGLSMFGETITDQIYTNVVTLGGEVGIDIDYSSAIYSGPYTAVAGDVFFYNPVPHGFTSKGFYIHDMADGRANLVINGGWSDPAVGTNTINMHLDTMTGLTVTDHVMINSSNGSMAKGLVMDGTNSILDIKAQYINLMGAIQFLTGNTFNSQFSGSIYNDSSHVATYMIDAVSANSIRNNFAGISLNGYATAGIGFGAASSKNNIYGVVVNPANITSPLIDGATPDTNYYGVNSQLTGPQGAMAPALGSITGGNIPVWASSGDGRLENGYGVSTLGSNMLDAASKTAHGVLLGNGTSEFNATAVGATGTVLKGNTGADPSFGAVDLTADVTGVLPVANGGTGNSGGAWSTYSTAPTVSGGSATLAGNYTLVGKTLTLSLVATVTSAGASIDIPLPNSLTAKTQTVLTGDEEGTSGHPMVLRIAASNNTGTVVDATTFSAAVPTLGSVYVFSGVIQVN